MPPRNPLSGKDKQQLGATRGRRGDELDRSGLPRAMPPAGDAVTRGAQVLCGYDDEHDALLSYGWTSAQGKAGGGAGYSTRADNGRRERLWLSPACLRGQDVLDFEGLGA